MAIGSRRRKRRAGALRGSAIGLAAGTLALLAPALAHSALLGAAAAPGASSAKPPAYAAVAKRARPRALAAPRISGAAVVGRRLSASRGRWAGQPRKFSYSWRRCNRAGGRCRAIRRATGRTYVVTAADVGATLRVAVSAANAAGRAAALSAHTRVVSAAAAPVSGVQHLEYVFVDGTTYVYDIDHGHHLVRTISLPPTNRGIRGVMVAPAAHLLFIAYGGDGGPNGNGSVLAYDLVADRIVWNVHLGTGVDSGAVSPDGSRIYLPTGELSSGGTWNILSTSNGAIIGTIHGGAGPHNTIASGDGRYVYLGGRNHNYLGVYETAGGHVREVGPLVSGVRPFTIDAANTIAFTTATGFDGFQVSNLTTGRVLYTVSFGPIPGGFPFTTASHGISLSPDGTQLYVIDAVHKLVQVYDVSGVARGVAPRALGAVHVSGWNGSESPCAYDCAQDGWLQHSLDGRFVYVGDSGEVIETATRRVAVTLSPLANTRKSLEIDWRNGVPVATSTRYGVGR
jgi:DNA-binding beta-propeller fold protein YncE